MRASTNVAHSAGPHELALHAPLARRGHVVSVWEWYEQQQPGLGVRFVAAVGAAIASACRWPNTGTPTIHDDHGVIVERKVATTGFPSAVRYRVTDQRLIVMAVYHQHRHPDFGYDRLP